MLTFLGDECKIYIKFKLKTIGLNFKEHLLTKYVLFLNNVTR